MGVFLAVFGLQRPFWGDEAHFVKTIRYFGNNLTLEKLKHYNEMSTPLPFILYAAWGRLFGFKLETLRILSVVIAFITSLSIHYLFFSVFQNAKTALLLTLCVILQPYMLGFSIFVFTDMLAILFLVLACIAVKRENPLLLAVSAALGLLCRQYLAFLPLAAGLYYLWDYVQTRQTRALQMLAAAILALLPTGLLFLLWQGTSPINSLRHIYLEDGFAFHPSFLTLYIVQTFVYLFPVAAVYWRTIYRERTILLLSLALSWLYWLFPVAPSSSAIEAEIDTVGLFHRLLRLSVGHPLEHGVFYLCFLLGLPILLLIIRNFYVQWQSKTVSFSLFTNLLILAFFAIMPFSYLGWEKYFLPIVPFVAMQLPLLKNAAPLTQPT
jgi:4-amino-4-deoxy-L-arabinose transferase-like glycosyltransferase